MRLVSVIRYAFEPVKGETSEDQPEILDKSIDMYWRTVVNWWVAGNIAETLSNGLEILFCTVIRSAVSSLNTVQRNKFIRFYS